jgi:ATP/maltotriose-dependent transcriptional regulator MalT
LLDQLFRLAKQAGDESLILAADHCGWIIEFARGDLTRARDYIEHGLTLYDPNRHRDHAKIYGHDSGVCALMSGSMIQWLAGYPDRALARSVEVQALAKRLDQPVDRMFANWGSAFVAVQSGESEYAVELSQDILKLSEEFGSKLFEALGILFQAGALTRQGLAQEGLRASRIALEKAVRVKARVWLHFFLAGFLEACLATDELDDGLRAVQESVAIHELEGERVFKSEVHRLYGELILAKGGGSSDAAEGEFQLAKEIARQQGAKSLELRAVMSLARLWAVQGNGDKAHDMLAECYDWFTEGIETADLMAARKLLGELQ